jgi:hypothetical protein
MLATVSEVGTLRTSLLLPGWIDKLYDLSILLHLCVSPRTVRYICQMLQGRVVEVHQQICECIKYL